MHTPSMLHLLPIRWLFRSVVVLVSTVVLAAVYAGAVGTGDALSDVKWIIRWSSPAALMLVTLPYAAWRWLPSIQRLTFPYLGGVWTGKLTFNSSRGSDTRDVTLTIRHSVSSIVLILDSAESTSRTLVVHAERDTGLNRDRLYYVYLNERKEGVQGAGDRYRGLAVLRAEVSNRAVLHGDYFTEQMSSGKLRLTRKQSHPWWALWK